MFMIEDTLQSYFSACASLLTMSCYDEIAPLTSNGIFVQTIVVTVAVTCGFLLSKTTYDNFRMRWARATVVVVGAGPIGLISVLIAAKSGKAAKVILFEEKFRNDMLNKPQQIAIEQKNVHFLKSLGVDFDNIEGCWQNKSFFTRIGVFQEYLLSILNQHGVHVDIRLHQKFTKETLKELDAIPGRMLVIVCDGSAGRSASLLGLSDEFVHHSCKAYGAVASLERPSERFIPTPEIRIHNLTFDLNAYGNDCALDPFPQGFHLKIFGTVRHRYMALAVPKCESKLVKTLKVVLDQSIMRSIFQACFNTYKTDNEEKLSDLAAVKCMKFSPRLFEIKLSHRMENVAYIQDANLFVVTEGEATRCLNYHSGMDINISLMGLYSLEQFICLAAPAETDTCITHALMYKYNHARSVTQEFLKVGIREAMYT